MRKILKRLTSTLGNAVLIAVLALGIATVLAATDWSTWIADMTTGSGEQLSSASWNQMVNAISENHDDVSNLADGTVKAGDAELLDGQEGSYYAVADELAQISNPNILENSGGEWLDKRGRSGMELSPLSYGVDGWRVENYNATMTVVDDELVFSTAQVAGYLVQPIENAELYSGKTLTASIRAKSDVDGTLYLYDGTDLLPRATIVGDGEYHTYSTVSTVKDNCTVLRFVVSIGTGSLNIDWAKLEEGSLATPRQEEIYARETTVSQISNPNALINSNFVINQRGASSYSGNNIYTVDRWKLQTDTGDNVSDASAGHLTFTNASSSGVAYFRQTVENYALYGGYDMTMTASVRTNIDGAYMDLWDGIGAQSQKLTADSAWHTVTLSPLTVSGSATNLDAIFRVVDGANAGTLDIDWVKLEQGDIATPYMIPDPQTELARAQRYYHKIGGATANQHMALGIGDTSSSVVTVIDFPVNMRTIPTFSYGSGGSSFRIYPNNFVVSSISMPAGASSSMSATLAISTASTISSNASYDIAANNDIGAYLAFDAEMY